MKYYCYETLRHKITEVAIDRESDSCVWIKGSRTNKISSYRNYFKTKDEAIEYKNNNIKTLIKKLEDNISYSIKHIEELNEIIIKED